MIFASIANWATQGVYTVGFMCARLGVSRSGYYAWARRKESARKSADRELIEIITVMHERLHGDPGVRRIRAELAAHGVRVAHKRVHRLMQVAGLQGRHSRAWKRTTIAGVHPTNAPDLIERNFTAEAPNEKWVGDITYIRTASGWVYLATVIDLHSRKIVGWSIADHMKTSLVTDALAMAITHRTPPPGVVFHSDRGTQYTSTEFANFCAKHNIRRSLGRTGICYDNAVAESFFATLKKELIHTRPWRNLKTVTNAVFTWIEEYYNRQRRHSYLGYLTPHEYELGFRHIYELSA